MVSFAYRTNYGINSFNSKKYNERGFTMNKAVIAVLALVVIIVAGVGGYNYMANKKAEEALDAYLVEMKASPQISDASYESVSVSFGGDITITDFSVTPVDTGEALVFEEVFATNVDLAHETPHHMDVTITGMKLTETMKAGLESNKDDEAAQKFLEKLNITDSIPLVAKFAYDYEEANEMKQTSAFSLSLPNLGAYKLDMVTKNIPIDAFEGAENQDPTMMQIKMMEVMSQASIPSLSMSLDDDGGVGEIMAIAAENSGADVDQMRAQMVVQMGVMADQFVPPDLAEFKEDAVSQIASFLEGGKELKVSIAPELDGSVEALQPVVMNAFMQGDFKSIINTLKLEVVAQ
jgi:hypothetical protein